MKLLKRLCKNVVYVACKENNIIIRKLEDWRLWACQLRPKDWWQSILEKRGLSRGIYESLCNVQDGR